MKRKIYSKPGADRTPVFGNPKNLPSDFVLDAFTALRNPSEDPDDRTFGLAEIEVDGRRVWAICSFTLGPRGPDEQPGITGFIPLFMTIPPGVDVRFKGESLVELTKEFEEVYGKTKN